MKVAVVGSRSISNREFIFNYLERLAPEAIISGGAAGVDKIAASFAKANNIPIIEILPDYKQYGLGAPLKRNDLIIDAADQVVAFWDGKSRGTKYTIDRANEKGKKVAIMYL